MPQEYINGIAKHLSMLQKGTGPKNTTEEFNKIVRTLIYQSFPRNESRINVIEDLQKNLGHFLSHVQWKSQMDRTIKVAAVEGIVICPRPGHSFRASSKVMQVTVQAYPGNIPSVIQVRLGTSVPRPELESMERVIRTILPKYRWIESVIHYLGRITLQVTGENGLPSEYALWSHRKGKDEEWVPQSQNLPPVSLNNEEFLQRLGDDPKIIGVSWAEIPHDELTWPD